VQGNDISNETPDRFLFVFEGLIATLPDKEARAKAAVLERLGRHKHAARCWRFDPHTTKRLWDLAWRHHYRFDIVTFKDPDFAEEIGKRMDHLALPVSSVFATTVPLLAQELSFMPSVAAVFDADPERRFSWGNRGRHVSDPSTFNPFA